jgi:hypothetical protein
LNHYFLWWSDDLFLLFSGSENWFIKYWEKLFWFLDISTSVATCLSFFY